MICPACSTALPDVADYCQSCGTDLYPDDQDIKRRFFSKPDEPVASFAIVSSIMPRGATRHPQTYRIAFTIAIGVALLASLFGALPIAVLVAAFAVPVVYLTYLYDVNLWKDAPVLVVGIAFALTGALSVGFSLVWKGWLPMRVSLSGVPSSPSPIAILLLVLLVPIVGEIIRQLGPVLLASRPKFDDLMDGVTFGITSGLAYAAGDTLIRQWDLLTGGLASAEPGQWAPLILLEGLIKPLIIGTASGLAAAEFAGLGKGYDGFSPRYFVAVGIAVGANAVYALGIYLLGFVGTPMLAIFLQIIFGAIILGLLILRIRAVLQLGLMEGALTTAACSEFFGGVSKADMKVCSKCEMPLMPAANFCNACGTQTEAAVVPTSVVAQEPEPGAADTPLEVSSIGEGE
ncbi:MAG: zinc ribbon domain-containing protein [Propionibacteriaceae bacterium]|nr:zinc ribbon domain-containing protein [Propionibacteriaceae bacterium]